VCVEESPRNHRTGIDEDSASQPTHYPEVGIMRVRRHGTDPWPLPGPILDKDQIASPGSADHLRRDAQLHLFGPTSCAQPGCRGLIRITRSELL
jgi:hypothetical protein